MQGGSLDRPVVYYRLEEARQQDGSYKEVPTKFATGWAGISSRSGRDAYRDAQRQARQALLLEARFQSGISPRHLVSFEGTMYEIEDVAVIERGARLLLTCYAFEVDATRA